MACHRISGQQRYEGFPLKIEGLVQIFERMRLLTEATGQANKIGGKMMLVVRLVLCVFLGRSHAEQTSDKKVKSKDTSPC